MVIGWFGAVFYALTELAFLQTYWYVDPAPSGAYLFAASAVIGILITTVLIRKKIPAAIAFILGALWALATVGLLFFGALRINAATDLSPHGATSYRLEKDRSLTPLAPDKPVLRFPQHDDYWSEQETGSTHPFVVRCGLLGFCQIERAEYVERIRNRPRKPPSPKPPPPAPR